MCLCFVKSWGIFVTLKALKLKKHEYYYHNAESVLVLIHKKKFLTWLKVSHEESKLDNMLLLNVFSLEPKAFPQLFCCELQNAIEKIVQSKHKLKFMLKKISITISLISKANNFEAIINKDGVTFPPKCWRGGGGLLGELSNHASNHFRSLKALQITITKEKGRSKIAAPI